MSKAQQTKERIIALSAPIFNRYGYSGTSMSDILKATGLEKGGVYNHFRGKEELALAAFDYNFKLMSRSFGRALKAAGDSPSRQLLAIIELYNQGYKELSDGCPIMNTATESDDANPPLRARAQDAMNQWRELIIRIVDEGKARGEFHDIDGDEAASLIIASIEGGMMLSKLYDEDIHLRRAVTYLVEYVRSSVIKLA
jgi:TetR/AcrR family transcriptional regulator, transcriptional repressor for nem operon